MLFVLLILVAPVLLKALICFPFGVLDHSADFPSPHFPLSFLTPALHMPCSCLFLRSHSLHCQHKTLTI